MVKLQSTLVSFYERKYTDKKSFLLSNFKKRLHCISIFFFTRFLFFYVSMIRAITMVSMNEPKCKSPLCSGFLKQFFRKKNRL